VNVVANDSQALLTCESGNPQIVFRDRSALLAEVVANSRVVKSCIQVNRKDDGLRNHEIENASEASLLVRSGQTVSVFTNHDDRKMMLMFEGENFCEASITTEKC